MNDAQTFEAAAERVARDVRTTTGRALVVVVSRLEDSSIEVSTTLDGENLGVWWSLGHFDRVPVGDLEAATVALADGLRESWLDEIIWGGWPTCPFHEHPLDPKLDGTGAAQWVCPRRGPVAAIGSLVPR